MHQDHPMNKDEKEHHFLSTDCRLLTSLSTEKQKWLDTMFYKDKVVLFLSSHE